MSKDKTMTLRKAAKQDRRICRELHERDGLQRHAVECGRTAHRGSRTSDARFQQTRFRKTVADETSSAELEENIAYHGYRSPLSCVFGLE